MKQTSRRRVANKRQIVRPFEIDARGKCRSYLDRGCRPLAGSSKTSRRTSLAVPLSRATLRGDKRQSERRVFVSPDSLMNYRLLRSGDQVLLVDTGVFGLLAALANYFVQLVVELAQLSHFLHHALVHEKRRPNCLVVFVGQLFQRQLNDSLVLQSLIPQ